MACIKPDQWGTLELNVEIGWYVGLSLNYYHCVKVSFQRTRAIRDCGTVILFPTIIPFPQIKLADVLRRVATEIIFILTHPPSTVTPSLEVGDPVRNALLKLAIRLKRIGAIQEP